MGVSKRVIVALLIAQGLSFLLSITAVTSAQLQSKGVALPATQLLLNYVLLALVSTPIWLWQERTKATPPQSHGSGWLTVRWPGLNAPWHYYALLAFLDVAANTLVTSAYQYTSMTSVALLDCFTIPAIMVLSSLVLKSRYNWGHFLGGLVCVAGLVVLVISDAASHRGDAGQSSGSNPVLGDAIVVLGATLYALCNVGEEYLLNDVSVMEFLAMVGMFGMVFNSLQVALLEGRALAAVDWSLNLAGPIVFFSLALFCFYQGTPIVLRWGGAALLNLSLLTSDLWTALAREIFFGGFGTAAVPFAFALVMEAAGILLYSYSGSVKDIPPSLPPSGEALPLWNKAWTTYVRLSNTDTRRAEDGMSEIGSRAEHGMPDTDIADEHEQEGRAEDALSKLSSSLTPTL